MALELEDKSVVRKEKSAGFKDLGKKQVGGRKPRVRWYLGFTLIHPGREK